MRTIGLAISLFGISMSSHGGILHKTFQVKNANVITPSVVEFTTVETQEVPEGKLALKLRYIDFEGRSEFDCTQDITDECERLQNTLDGSNIQLNLDSYDRQKGYYFGDIFVGDDELVYKMISEGWYKFDYTQTRSKHFVLLQKKAMCTGVGIWQGQSHLLDVQCNK